MAKRTHSLTSEVIERDSNRKATVWLGVCGRHQKFTAPTYEEMEDKWRRHVHEETGVAPEPMGDKANRWQPEAVSA